ncbi:OsmC family protein [Metallumcola ferriviriculae]|uniref:OsmC family protein n=1 Tax=Metallumcola ferriviriculae TaxID=3039180 RepID=A0AAU0UMT9_9FIRM|nr:OsmC family protein [Desulfitibacteraceae bacterium MK1]
MSKDLHAVFNQVIKVFSRKPEMAKSVYSIKSRLVENLKTESRAGSHTLVIDEPQELGGTDAGPNPLDTFLVALGTCQEITYAAYAAVMGLKLDKVEVDVEGDIDLRGMLSIDDVKPGFSGISYVTRITSPEPEEKIRQLVTAVEEHCPVMDTIKSPTMVAGRLEIQQSS